MDSRGAGELSWGDQYLWGSHRGMCDSLMMLNTLWAGDI